jgi:hypothetical protein
MLEDTGKWVDEFVAGVRSGAPAFCLSHVRKRYEIGHWLAEREYTGPYLLGFASEYYLYLQRAGVSERMGGGDAGKGLALRWAVAALADRVQWSSGNLAALYRESIPIRKELIGELVYLDSLTGMGWEVYDRVIQSVSDYCVGGLRVFIDIIYRENFPYNLRKRALHLLCELAAMGLLGVDELDFSSDLFHFGVSASVYTEIGVKEYMKF